LEAISQQKYVMSTEVETSVLVSKTHTPRVKTGTDPSTTLGMTLLFNFKKRVFDEDSLINGP
jgi:hypothetical protein